MQVRYDIWRVREDRTDPDEGRIDWRDSLEEAKELKEELDKDTSDEHEIVREYEV